MTPALLWAQTAQLDSNQSLFTVLAAMDAGGILADAASPSNHPLRKAVRDEVLKRRPASLNDLRDYFRQHRQETPPGELRMYTSWALLTDGPPAFAFRHKQHQLPPDVAALPDLAPLLGKFYKEAGIEDLYRRSQAAFEQALQPYHEPSLQAVQLVSAYLRAPLSGSFGGRKFQVVVDLLGPPNQILFLPFLDDYFLVVTHSAEPHTADVRQAYIHYLVDPMVTNNQEKIEEKKALLDYVQNAPIADFYKQDFLLLFTKSLVRAIEAQLERPASVRPALVDRAMKEGFVLTAHFAEQLPVYQKQEQSMRFYFPELVKSIDLAKEERRLDKLEFAAGPVVRKARTVPPPPPPEKSAVEKALDEAEELYTARQLDKGREAFTAILTMTDQKPLQGRAYYGLARIAALNRDPELAQRHFQKVLELGPAPAEKAWTHVYLARLSQDLARRMAQADRNGEAATELDTAAGHYRAALAVEGASEKAREAATKGLEEISRIARSKE